jgi:hypothetical protein
MYYCFALKFGFMAIALAAKEGIQDNTSQTRKPTLGFFRLVFFKYLMCLNYLCHIRRLQALIDNFLRFILLIATLGFHC